MEPEPYIFHFPDGNASIARLLVRDLIPAAVPGTTVEDSIAARVDYSRLDRSGQGVRIRLSSTAARVMNTRDGNVEVTYLRGGRAYKAKGTKSVLACWNMMIPFICPELPQADRDLIRAIAEAIANEEASPDPALDLDADGTVDVADLALAIDRAHGEGT